MSKIESFYEEYIQKSRIFIYPALGLKRGSSVTPIQIYTAWKNMYGFSDCKLCCLYHLRKDEEFRLYLKNVLFNHPYYHDHHMVVDEKMVVVFDLKEIKDDWDKFLVGKYSKLSPKLKKKIRAFYGVSNLGVIDSFLYPERYFNMFAGILTTTKVDEPEMVKLLKEVGELCSIPDFEKEELCIEILDLHKQNIMP